MEDAHESPMDQEARGRTGSLNPTVVVVAVDLNEYTEYALQFYIDHLHKPDNVLFLVHVTEQTLVTSPGVVGATEMQLVTKDKKRLEEKADTLVNKLEETMKARQINGRIEREHGETGPSIITFANHKNADYIVVGCRGKGTVRKTLTGSVTDYVSKHSNVPVVIARHKDHLEHFHLKNPFHRHGKKEHHHAESETGTSSP